MSKFCHLHTHSGYSLLDGYGGCDKIVKRASELGQTAIAITDHGSMSGVIDTKTACVEYGVKFIPGSELYITPFGTDADYRREDGKRSNTAYHLTVLAYNQTGYANLLKLTELANKVGFYYVPRISYDMLEQYNEGLIITSGCMASEISQAMNPEKGVKHTDYKLVNEILGWASDVFGEDRYYIELQDHNIQALKEINREVRRINDHYGFQYLVTNDSHYAVPEGAEGQADLLCLNTGSSRINPNDFVKTFINNPNYYLTSYDEMKRKDYGFDVPQSGFTNTLKIAEMTEDIKLGYEPEVKKYRFPVMPEYSNDYDVELEEVLKDGFVYRYGHLKPGDKLYVESRERINMELSTIKELGFSVYFLCIYDISRYCIEESIPMTVRGSAGGSIVLYCLGVTDFCPLEYDLLFERFLNSDRVSAPDVDLDIDPGRRDKIIRYLINKYGEDQTAQVATFNTIKGRGAIRAATRLLERPYDDGDALVQKMDDDDCEVTDSELEILEVADRIEGQFSTVGVHASAVIVSDRPLVNDYPLIKPKSASKSISELIVGLNYETAESIGGIKVDLLGVSALGIMYSAMKLVNDRYGTNYTFDNIPVDDKESFELINSGNLAEIFQLSGHTASGVVKQIKPQTVEDIMVINALARPGPLQYAQLYADRMHGKVEIEYLHPDLSEVLAETQGIMTYQEQIMRVSQIIAGFTGNEADTLRKAVSKKKGFEKIRDKFVDGAINNGYDVDFVNDLWDDIMHFAGYGFNASHACAYSRIAVKQAYLKSKYTIEYYAAAMTGRIGNDDKMSDLLKEMSAYDVKLLPPRLGRSLPSQFSIDYEQNGIRYPYNSVKNVGKSGNYLKNISLDTIDNITVKDLALFKKASIRALESLALVGTFDHLFNGDRNDAVKAVPYLSQGLIPEIQLTLMPEYEKAYTKAEFLFFEKSLAGMYLSGHPLDDYVINQPKFSDEVYKTMNDQIGLFVGVVISIRLHRDKSGNIMSFVKVEDASGGNMTIVIFASLYKRFDKMIKVGYVLKILGEVNVRYGKTEEEEAKLKKYGRVSILAKVILGESK